MDGYSLGMGIEVVAIGGLIDCNGERTSPAYILKMYMICNTAMFKSVRDRLKLLLVAPVAVVGGTRTPCQLNNFGSGVHISHTALLDPMLKGHISIPSDGGSGQILNRHAPAWMAPLVQTLSVYDANLQFPAFDHDGSFALYILSITKTNLFLLFTPLTLDF
jgi:hypothetical protein